MSTTPRQSLLAFALLAVCSAAHAQFAATYDFAVAISDVPTASNVTFASVIGTNTTVTRLSGAVASSTNWVTGGGSADTTEYVSFTLNANTGYTLSLTSISYKSSVSSTGPLNTSVALFIGGILQETSSIVNPTVTSTATNAAMGTAHVFDFADKTGIVSTSLAELRIYGWGGSSAAGAFRLDDITISGSVTAIPEPATYAAILGVVALTGVMIRRRRLQRAT